MDLNELISNYNRSWREEGGFNPVVVAVNPKLKCPLCSEILVDIKTDTEGRVSSRIHLPRLGDTDDCCLYSDGDTIQVPEKLKFADRTRFDSVLLMGKCYSCGGHYYTIELYLSSRSVNISIGDDEHGFVLLQPMQSKYCFAYMMEEEVPYLMFRHEGVSVGSDPDHSPLIVTEHILGPFALNSSEKLIGKNGVSSCEQSSDIWNTAAISISTIGRKLL